MLLTLKLRIAYNKAEEGNNIQKEPDSSIVWACALTLIFPWLRIYCCSVTLLLATSLSYGHRSYVGLLLNFAFAYPCISYWSRDAPTSLTFKSVRSAHKVFLCFVFIWEQTATCATFSINWLVFITEMKSVYSAVRTGSLTLILLMWRI
jgi:hypothetical protein